MPWIGRGLGFFMLGGYEFRSDYKGRRLCLDGIENYMLNDYIKINCFDNDYGICSVLRK